MTARHQRSDDGIAIITVMLFMMVVTTLVVGMIGSSMAAQRLSRRDQDRTAAMAAAQAGVDDYMYRLQLDDGYWRYTSANPPASPANRAFTGWLPIPGSTGAGAFHYDVDAARIATEGVVVLTSTGRVRGVARTVQVELRRRSFLDYMYFTDYESEDPYSGWTTNPQQVITNCGGRYWWSGRPGDPTCRRVYFADDDEIEGPVHSNDTLQIFDDPQFKSSVTTSFPGSTCTPTSKFNFRWQGYSDTRWDPCDDHDPDFLPGDPQYAPLLQMPQSNSELRALGAGTNGCLFKGPTRITLKSTGTMDVRNSTTGGATNCATGSGRPLPRNGVLYVEGSTTCPTGNAAKNPLGYPIAGDVTKYECTAGDVFLSGDLKGQLTIATTGRIIIVGDTRYTTGDEHILGLVPNRSVEVYHPVDSGGNNLADTTHSDHQETIFDDPDIEAAILALSGLFMVQNPTAGAGFSSELDLIGSIAQRWRGPVGYIDQYGVNHGFEKDYRYDPRMAYRSPPYFLQPTVAPWRLKTTSETSNPALPP